MDNLELHGVCFSCCVISLIKSREKIQVGNVARMGEEHKGLSVETL